jgi:VanZ family protein
LIRRSRKGIATVLICANLLFIWGNSLLPASVSGAISEWVKGLLDLLVGGDGMPSEGDGPLRKLAHFLEFCSLGLLLSWRFCMSRPEFWIPPAFLSGVSAAFVDELLQHFSPGRAPRILDVGIDAMGVALGTFLLILGKYIRKTKQSTGG